MAQAAHETRVLYPTFVTAPEQILEEARQKVDSFRAARLKIIERVRPSHATFENVITPLAQAENLLTKEAQVLGFYRFVSADAELREASNAAQQLYEDAMAESISPPQGEELFRLVEAVSRRNELLSQEDQRLLNKKSSEFLRSGHGLQMAARHRYHDISQRLRHLRLQFRRNLIETTDGVWLTLSELEGVSEDVISGLERGGTDGDTVGKVYLPFTMTTVYPVLRYALHDSTRKLVYIGNDNRCRKNIDICKQILCLRDEAARILGYENHAAFRLEDRMIKDLAKITEFLDELQVRTRDIAAKELDELRALKKADLLSRNEETDAEFYHWDHSFYHWKLLETKYNVKHTLLSEWFSMDHTISGMFDIYQKLFGIAFQRLRHGRGAKEGENVYDSAVWHDEVELFIVRNESRPNDVLGLLYLDLFPRPGKHGHCSNFNLWPGFETATGGRQLPATALVCNFSKPTAEKPSLLRHTELVTLFHEMGHAVHDLVSKTRYSHFHGTNSPVDFGEMPSQLLENWCWSPIILKMISKHYSAVSPLYLETWRKQAPSDSQPSEKMPDDLIEQLLETKNVNGGLAILRQLSLAVFDLTVHSPKSHEEAMNLNIAATYNRLRRELIGTHGPEGLKDDEWGFGYTTFAHLVGDYDAGYYSYLLSQVYSSDIFHSVFKGDPLNFQASRRYRHVLLQKGASQDEFASLVELLGRTPNAQAFREDLRI